MNGILDLQSRILQENKAANLQLQKNILSGVEAFNLAERNKLDTVKERLEIVNSMAQELGNIHGENVEEVKNELLKEIKGSVIKERKLGKLSLGNTVDLSKLNSFNDRITKLGRLAENSRIIDKIYKTSVERIDKDKLILNQNKGNTMKKVLKILADRDKLESMDVADIANEVDSIIRNDYDSLSIINEYMGKIGYQQYTDSSGASYNLPNVFTLGESGKPELSIDGMKKVTQAIEQANSSGFNIDPNEVLPRFVNQFNTSITQPKVKEKDPLLEESRRLDNQLKRDKIEEAKKEEQSNELQKEAINTIARAISLPRTISNEHIKERIFDILNFEGYKITESDDGKTLNIQKKGKSDPYLRDLRSEGYEFEDKSSMNNFNINLRKDEGSLQFILNSIFSKDDMEFLAESRYINELSKLLSTEESNIQSLTETTDSGKKQKPTVSEGTLSIFKKQ